LEQSRQKIGVFIISPNDVKPEREIVKKVCKSFNTQKLSFNIEHIAWEDYPFRYENNPQENIDPYLEQADIFIVILWYRLGTVVEGCRGAITGEENVTGTQYEIEKILSMGKENLFFYIKNKEDIPLKYKELEEAVEQKRKLERFLEKMEIQPGSTKRSYHTFDTPEAFEEKLKKHLSKALYQITGEKVALKQKRSRQRVYYLSGLLLIGVLAGLLFDRSGRQEVKTHLKVAPSLEKTVDRTRNDHQSLIKQKRLYIEAENFILPAKTIPSITFTLNEHEAKYRLQISYNETIQYHTIADQNMVTVHCIVSYDLQDRDRNERIQTGMFDVEVIDFDLTSVQHKCKKKAQYEMVLRLKSILQGVK